MANTKPRVLVTESEYRKAEARFAAAPGLECLRAPNAEAELASAVLEARASHAIVGSGTYSNALYDALPAGGVIARFGVGHDGIDKIKATASGLLCTNTPGVLNQSVAEHTMMLIAAAARALVAMSASLTKGGWDPVILRLTGLEKDDSGRKGPSTGYVGVHAPGTARDKEVYGHGASGLLITYASNTEPRDAVLVVVNDSVDELRVTEARWVRRAKTMWTPRDLTETEAELAAHPPVVEVTLMNLGRMRVPLRKQRFAEREAELPPGLRIQRVPLPGP